MAPVTIDSLLAQGTGLELSGAHKAADCDRVYLFLIAFQSDCDLNDVLSITTRDVTVRVSFQVRHA